MVRFVFWFFLSICALAMPIIILATSRRWRFHPPEKINNTYGYRTARSMKSPEAWTFAHTYCARIWQKAGWTALTLSAIGMTLALPLELDRMGWVCLGICLVQCAALCCTFIPVERALKRAFEQKKGP